MSAVIPPVTSDHWSYAHGEFFVEASGRNLHRRATIPEIKTQFDGTPDSSKDRPAHWYEAQLVHYGLPPSKNKGTAKMRLYEALNGGKLTVPSHVLKLEADLKKEWTKRDREAKQALKNQSTTTTKGGTKRKATDDTPQAGSSSTTATKKARTIATPKPKAAPKPAAPKPAATKPAAAEPAKKQTARRGGTSASRAGSHAVASSSSRPPPAPSAPAPPPSRPIQTARRSNWNGPFGGHTNPSSSPAKHSSSTPSSWNSYSSSNNNTNDDPPPPYPGSPTYDSYNQYSNPPPTSSPSLPPLGLLNGNYELQPEDPSFDERGDSRMTVTLDGTALWGSFTVGPVEGIWRLEQRPYQSSHDKLYLRWRGDDEQGGRWDEEGDGSYIKFLGDGLVEGAIAFYGRMICFDGRRVSRRDETRSGISAYEMRDRWAERAL
ncbi:hypothetical protein QBC41DRAFT_280972 [Cercophora samala]|uniref:Uncharacterized protein n=1 Tax=Cercophora samala TaxID=330535 RepID=A0AA39Z8R8_9PEZI|nr:hypothetical protein QBC41DRAFT_280972 [Cercophora samala]